MAEQKLSYNQIADPKLLDPLKKEIQDVINLLDTLEKSLKDVVAEAADLSKQTPLNSFENIEKREKAIKDTTTALQQLDKVEKDRIKLDQRLKELEDGRTQANFNLREQIRLQTKELRDNAKEANNTRNAYEQLTKETNDAQKRFKALAAEFGANSDEAKEARAEFERLDDQLREVNDAARDGRRDVGRYEKGVEALRKTFNRFARATVIIEIFKLLQNAVNANSEGVAEFQKIWVNVTATITVLADRLITVFSTLSARIQRFVLGVRLDFAELGNVLGRNDEQIEDLRKQYNDLASDAETDLSGVFNGIGQEISDLINLQQNLIDQTLDYRREIADLQKELAGVIVEQREFRAGFEDASASLEEQIRDGVAFRKSLQETQAIEEQIAARRLELAQQSAIANRFNVASQEELAQATLEYNQLVADQAEELAATEREIQRLRDDVVQLNLDFYIDDFDNRKTVNERIIADETQTFETRRRLLEENLRGAEEAFDREEAALNESLAQRGKAQLDFDELRQKSSSEEIARVIRESGISEPLAIRALEVLRERRTFLQDNAESQRDLNNAEAESRLIQSDILLQQEALTRLQERGVNLEMVLEELASARLQNEIDNIRQQLTVAEEGSARAIQLNQELNDKLLEQDQEAYRKRLEELQKFGEASGAILELIGDLFTERSEKRLAAIDEELEAEQRRIETLNALAAEGNEDAENNLAITEARQRQLELEREQQLKRQEQAELALTAIQTYAQKVQAGNPNPLASTVSDIQVLRAFVASLDSFFDGTVDTGTVANPLDSNGGRLAILHDNERIVDKANNKIIGKMSNTELANLAARERNRSGGSDIYGEKVFNELKQLKQITRDKPDYMGTDYDSMSDMIIKTVKKGRRLERIHRKKGGIWGR